jgi:glutamate dehydrogenase
MASLAALRSGPDLVEIAEQKKLPADATARVYFGVGTALSLDWIREQIESLGVEGHWQAVARTTLRDNIYNLQRMLCMQVLNESRQRVSEQTLQGWVTRHQKAVDHLRQTVADMRSLPQMDFATLSVALQAVRRMAEG